MSRISPISCAPDHDYNTLRSAFRRVALQSGADLLTYPLAGYQGPKGEGLTIDVATMGEPDAQNIVFSSAGTHGVELPLGSLLQRQWMDMAKHDSRCRYVFVHALNPYGAAHGLRTDQNNVDLNRNFVPDWSQRPETSRGYRDIAAALSPDSLSPHHIAKSWAKLAGHIFVPGRFPAFKRAVVAGQYDYPDGLFYGGQSASWSSTVWENIASQQINPQTTRRIWHVDCHTGEGPRGKMQILVATAEGSDLHRRAQPLGETGNIRLLGASYAHVTGDLVGHWPKLASPQCEVTPFAIEFGTTRSPIPGLDVLNTMIMRQTLRVCYNDTHPKADRIIAGMRRIFAPLDDPAWLAQTQQQGRALWKKLMQEVSPPR